MSSLRPRRPLGHFLLSLAVLLPAIFLVLMFIPSPLQTQDPPAIIAYILGRSPTILCSAAFLWYFLNIPPRAPWYRGLQVGLVSSLLCTVILFLSSPISFFLILFPTVGLETFLSLSIGTVDLPSYLSKALTFVSLIPYLAIIIGFILRREYKTAVRIVVYSYLSFIPYAILVLAISSMGS